jgi:prepilin-type N-terminal cleavage/methylation domain-containing protein
MKQAGNKSHGFTLLEMLISAVLAAFIALVAMAGLRGVTAVRATVDRHSESSDELRIAAEQIRTDLANVMPLGRIVRFEGQVSQDGSATSPRLILRTFSSHKARKDMPESELYEVEYFVVENNSVKTLMRRVCPITGIDSTTSEEKTDGGILETLAEPIVSFDVGYFDSGNWSSTWSADNQRPPQLVLINLAVDCTVAGGKKKLFTRQVTAGFDQSQFTEETNTSDFSWEQMEDQWTQVENEG